MFFPECAGNSMDLSGDSLRTVGDLDAHQNLQLFFDLNFDGPIYKPWLPVCPAPKTTCVILANLHS